MFNVDCGEQGNTLRRMALAVVQVLEERVIAAVDAVKEKHSAQITELLDSDIPGFMRAHIRAPSLKLRHKEYALGHIQRYEEAEKVRAAVEGFSNSPNGSMTWHAVECIS
jgi:hypothetical protein